MSTSMVTMINEMTLCRAHDVRLLDALFLHPVRSISSNMERDRSLRALGSFDIVNLSNEDSGRRFK